MILVLSVDGKTVFDEYDLDSESGDASNNCIFNF